MFKFSVTLDDNDYFEYNKHVFFNGPAGRNTLLLYRLLVPMLGAFAIFMFWITGADAILLIGEAVLFAILSVVFFLLAKPFAIKSIRSSIANHKKAGKLPYSKESTLLFEEDTFTSTTPEAITTLKYPIIERIVETEKAVYVMVGVLQAVIIPLKAFSDDAEKTKFIEFIQGKIAATSVGRSG